MSVRSQSILTAVDPAGCSTLVAEVAAQLAADLGAPVVLVTAVHLPEGVHADTPISDGPLAGQTALHALQTDARSALHELVSIFQRKGVPVDIEVLMGDPAQAVVERAQRGCRFVVVGTHGRTGIARFFFGSVAEQIVRRSPAPVLTVRADAFAMHPSATQQAVDALADG